MKMSNIKVVLLCGGLGTRLAEETRIKPKPMVKIGSKPIIEHIIKYYVKFGFNNFIIALGYKGNLIKKYFIKNKIKNVNIKFVRTGQYTLTGGRLLRLRRYLIKDKLFFLTYGDGLSNVNLKKLLRFHIVNKKIATVTAVRPPVRFGELFIQNNKVLLFKEKQQASKNWISGGFFVFTNKIFNYLQNDKTILEKNPVKNLCRIRQLMAFKHYKFWQCMDTLRDKKLLNKIWRSGKAPWRVS
jgi:glucose-1-phosphate cytidylyltransferase